jgi:hypothetical protein
MEGPNSTQKEETTNEGELQGNMNKSNIQTPFSRKEHIR